MPYYIYRVGPLGVLTKQGENENFRAARSLANDWRKTLSPDSGAQIKIVFAANELTAEDLLATPRELDPTLSGDDY